MLVAMDLLAGVREAGLAADESGRKTTINRSKPACARAADPVGECVTIVSPGE